MAEDRASQTPGSSSIGLQSPGYAACNPCDTLGGWVRAEEVVEALLRQAVSECFVAGPERRVQLQCERNVRSVRLVNRSTQLVSSAPVLWSDQVFLVDVQPPQQNLVKLNQFVLLEMAQPENALLVSEHLDQDTLTDVEPVVRLEDDL
jgi:hypothetical protein